MRVGGGGPPRAGLVAVATAPARRPPLSLVRAWVLVEGRPRAAPTRLASRLVSPSRASPAHTPPCPGASSPPTPRRRRLSSASCASQCLFRAPLSGRSPASRHSYRPPTIRSTAATPTTRAAIAPPGIVRLPLRSMCPRGPVRRGPRLSTSSYEGGALRFRFSPNPSLVTAIGRSARHLWLSQVELMSSEQTPISRKTAFSPN